MPIELHVVDAFTDRPFAGNPAAVCVLERPLDEATMQNIAREMNLSETAFLRQSASDRFHLRWFTPGGEVDLCGHATLASAHILWQEAHVPANVGIAFDTLSGELRARREKKRIVLDFPTEIARPVAAPDDLKRAMTADVDCVLANRLDYLVVLRSPKQLRELQPDMTLLKRLDQRGVIVTSPSDDPRFDFLSRFFVPSMGIDEDPVTGSAHCALGPFWGERLGKTEMTGYQASRRGGIVDVRLRKKENRVDLIGEAVTVTCTQMLVTL